MNFEKLKTQLWKDVTEGESLNAKNIVLIIGIIIAGMVFLLGKEKTDVTLIAIGGLGLCYWYYKFCERTKDIRFITTMGINFVGLGVILGKQSLITTGWILLISDCILHIFQLIKNIKQKNKTGA